MDFELTEEQKILKDSARDFLANECPKDKVREIEESAEGYSSELWKKMADLGWMGLLFPEEYNGSGFTFEDLTVLLDEIGYNIFPGPYISTVVTGGLAILTSGNDDQKKEFLPKIASGESIFTFALTEIDGLYDADAVNMKAELQGDDIIVSGTKMFVPFANVADYIICAARTSAGSNPEEGITVFIADTKASGLESEVLDTLTRDKQCEVVFNNVKVSKKNVIGEIDQGWPIIKDILQKAAVAACAEMIGGARAVLDMTIQYSADRVQFGRAIGSFQAVQHHAANMWLDIKAARVLTEKAAWLISNGVPAAKEIAMAKARTGDSYRRVTTLGHQVHGAISFTIENDMYLYHRRSVVGDLTFGNSDYQRKIVAKELLG